MKTSVFQGFRYLKLQATVELKQIRIEMKRMKDEQARQRYQQVEIMEKVREIENSL